MGASPAFTIILSTWNRGRHIIPTIRSALAQDFPDFELLVIGDACDDDTAEAVAPFVCDNVVWINLPARGGSQSFANNEGLRQARGGFIAYLGHDDIWAADHLSSLARVFASPEAPDFAVSGALVHGPEGSDVCFVTGIFEADGAQFEHFFPPSSLAHRASVIPETGPWRAPGKLRYPVDSEFQLRAALAGCRFASTGEITVHKFASAHRYLSYLRPDSDEQEKVLARLSGPRAASFVEARRARARATGRFMWFRHANPLTLEPDQARRRAFELRGLAPKQLVPVAAEIRVEQDDASRAFDWHEREADGATFFRWSGPNPRPRLLLPFTSVAPVAIRLAVLDSIPRWFEDLSVDINDVETPFTLSPRADGGVWLECVCQLLADRASVMRLNGRVENGGDFADPGETRRLGARIGEMILRPATPIEKSP